MAPRQAGGDTGGLPGVVVWEQNRHLVATAGGAVDALSGRLGSIVRAGQSIAHIDDVAARAALRRSELLLASVEAEHERAIARLRDVTERLNRRLTHPELFSRDELAALELEQSLIELDVKATKARTDERIADLDDQRRLLQSHDIRAPFTGIITQRIVDVGSWVSTGQPLVTISGGKLLARWAIPRNRLQPWLASGAVTIRPTDADEVYEADILDEYRTNDLADMVYLEAALKRSGAAPGSRVYVFQGPPAAATSRP